MKVTAAVVSPELATVTENSVVPHPEVVGAAPTTTPNEGSATVIVSSGAILVAQRKPRVIDTGVARALDDKVREVAWKPIGEVTAVDLGIEEGPTELYTVPAGCVVRESR